MDAELRSMERLCSKDDLSDSNVATLTALGLKAAQAIRRTLGVEADLEQSRSRHKTCQDNLATTCTERDQLRADLAVLKEDYKRLDEYRAEILGNNAVHLTAKIQADSLYRKACDDRETTMRLYDIVRVTEDSKDAELAKVTSERDAAVRGADRLRHGVAIEGDFVCPTELQLAADFDQASHQVSVETAEQIAAWLDGYDSPSFDYSDCLTKLQQEIAYRIRANAWRTK